MSVILQGEAENSKFRIGQRVLCRHPDYPEWESTVIASADTGDVIEYEVEDAPRLFGAFPLLLWEHQMEAVE